MKMSILLILSSLIFSLVSLEMPIIDSAELPVLNNQSSSDLNQNSKNQSDTKANSFQLPIILPIFKLPEKTRETVNLESERLPSKLFTVYDNSHNFVNQNFKVKHSFILEKYCFLLKNPYFF